MTTTTGLATALVGTSILVIVVALVAIRQRITITDLRQTVTAFSIISNKRRNTIDEQAQMLVEMNDRNERLHEDQRRMQSRLPRLALDPELGVYAAGSKSGGQKLDPDPGRPYTRDYDPEATP